MDTWTACLSSHTLDRFTCILPYTYIIKGECLCDSVLRVCVLAHVFECKN